eukprot:821304-Alexandrium_andersonii.AAC.1
MQRAASASRRAGRTRAGATITAGSGITASASVRARAVGPASVPAATWGAPSATAPRPPRRSRGAHPG